MWYESNKRILETELVHRVPEEHFLPETHRMCIDDVKDGNPLSLDCIKAIREYSLFNKLKMDFIWNEVINWVFFFLLRKFLNLFTGN